MASDQQRRERVANGSRRKRDLAAVAPGFDYDAFIAEHFPDERYGAVRQATFHVIARHHHRQDPTPSEVRERMVELGTTREQETEPKGTR